MSEESFNPIDGKVRHTSAKFKAEAFATTFNQVPCGISFSRRTAVFRKLASSQGQQGLASEFCPRQ